MIRRELPVLHWRRRDGCVDGQGGIDACDDLRIGRTGASVDRFGIAGGCAAVVVGARISCSVAIDTCAGVDVRLNGGIGTIARLATSHGDHGHNNDESGPIAIAHVGTDGVHERGVARIR